MKKVMFVCHGNICRSTMAEAVLRHLAKESNTSLCIDSSGVSDEERGNPIHRGTVNELNKHHIPFQSHRAQQITQSDFDTFDHIICMDRGNLYQLHQMFGPSSKIELLLERDVADPWYTGNFSQTWSDIWTGCHHLLRRFQSEEKA